MRSSKAVINSSRVLLDSQVVVQSYLEEELPKKVRDLLADPTTERLVSVASLVEIAIKSASGKIDVSATDLQKALRDLAITVIPFTDKHAFKLFALPTHHRDPFDRMIIATALAEDIPIVGGDRQFRRYAGLKVIW